MSFLRHLPKLLKASFGKWKADNAMRLAASLAYYTAFSMAPLLLAAIAVAGMLFGDEVGSPQIYRQLRDALGPAVAEAIQSLVEAAREPATGIWATVLAFLLALFGASGVFGELKDSLNIIWKQAPPAGSGIWRWIRNRFLSIGMVLGVCFLLLVSLVVSAGLGAVEKYSVTAVPGIPTLIQFVAICVSFAFTTVLFALMFKFLPDTNVAWRDVRHGSIVTSLLFTLGKSGLEFYIAKAGTASGFGAAGSLALVLVWVYYSAQIFLLGAEFTAVYAMEEGSRSNRPALPRTSVPTGLTPAVSRPR